MTEPRFWGPSRAGRCHHCAVAFEWRYTTRNHALQWAHCPCCLRSLQATTRSFTGRWVVETRPRFAGWTRERPDAVAARIRGKELKKEATK